VDLAQQSGGVDIASVGVHGGEGLDLTLEGVDVVAVLAQGGVVAVETLENGSQALFVLVDAVSILLDFVGHLSEGSLQILDATDSGVNGGSLGVALVEFAEFEAGGRVRVGSGGAVGHDGRNGQLGGGSELTSQILNLEIVLLQNVIDVLETFLHVLLVEGNVEGIALGRSNNIGDLLIVVSTLLFELLAHLIQVLQKVLVGVGFVEGIICFIVASFDVFVHLAHVLEDEFEALFEATDIVLHGEDSI